jgi:hypothetical protein
VTGGEEQAAAATRSSEPIKMRSTVDDPPKR